MPSKSKAQQKFMGMVHALKKGDIKPSDVSQSVRDAAKSMKKSDAKDFASTKHKGLPRKVKQEILNRLKEYANKMGTDHLGGDDYTSSKKGGLRDFDGYDNVDYNKDMPMDEGMFSTIDHIRQNSKNVRDFIKNVLSDKDFRDMKTDKDFIKYLGSIYEGTIQEAHYTAIANLGTKKAKENLDSFDELQKFMDKMKSRKAISVQVTKINGSRKQTINYDWDGRNWVSKGKKGVKEGPVPQNWMQGRTSDYHTKLRGKKREYDDTNFDKENSGQTDLEEGTKPDYNSKGYKDASKLVAKLRSSTFRKYNDDELEQFRMVIAQSFDLREYASKQTLSYLPADDRDNLDEVMITLTQNIAQEIIPMNTWSRYASDGKKNAEFVKNLMRDLTQTLNKFYKSHNINVRLKEK